MSLSICSDFEKLIRNIKCAITIHLSMFVCPCDSSGFSIMDIIVFVLITPFAKSTWPLHSALFLAQWVKCDAIHLIFT